MLEENKNHRAILGPENGGGTNKAGDIIVTNSTSMNGILGHAGIYLDSDTILHIAGRESGKVERIVTISEKDWNATYDRSKVIRPNNSHLGKEAAKVAEKIFKNKYKNYRIDRNPYNITETYCSEIVFYSYFGAGHIYKSSIYGEPSTKAVIHPYFFITNRNVKHNNFYYIDSIW